MRELVAQGNQVTAVTPFERREKKETKLTIETNFTNLQVKTLNIQKVNVAEKGIGMILLSKQFYKAIKKHSLVKKYDLIIYSTPPITLYNLIRKLKKKTGASTYLLLKDIFPQNAVDMGMMKAGGVLHSYFSKIERKLYQVSDHIGCMSSANVTFIKKYHPYVAHHKLHVNPNSIEPLPYKISNNDTLKLKYNIPLKDKILVYGGNLGKPQGIHFLLEILKQQAVIGVHYLIVGSGSEYEMLKNWFDKHNPSHATLLDFLPKKDYDALLALCDIGLIFLSRSFLIPNFPSRLLSYLEMGMPVISCTDENTDIGDIIENGKCGFKVMSGDLISYNNAVNSLTKDDQLYSEYTLNARKLLEREYTVSRSVAIINERLG